MPSRGRCCSILTTVKPPLLWILREQCSLVRKRCLWSEEFDFPNFESRVVRFCQLCGAVRLFHHKSVMPTDPWASYCFNWQCNYILYWLALLMVLLSRYKMGYWYENNQTSVMFHTENECYCNFRILRLFCACLTSLVLCLIASSFLNPNGICRSRLSPLKF